MFAEQVGAATGRLFAFYLGVFLLYSANQLLLLAARWGLAGLGSPLLLSLTAILPTLPQIGAGMLGPQRMGGRGHLRATTLLGTAAVGAAALLAFLGAGSGGVLATALLLGTLLGSWVNALAVPQGQAVLMQVLPVERRVRGSRDFEIASRIPMVLAPLAGGGLILALGVPPALAAVALLLALAALALGKKRGALAQGADARRPAVRRSLDVVQRDRWLATALLVRAVSNVVWPAYLIALPLLVLHRLHGGAGAYGLILALYGGSTIGAAALSGRMRREHLRLVYFLSWIVTGLGFLIVAESSRLIAAGLGAAVAGAGSPYVHMALDTHIGTEVDREDQEALYAFQRLVTSTAGLLGSFGAGILLLRATPAFAVTLSGAALAACGIAGGAAALLGKGAVVSRRAASERE